MIYTSSIPLSGDRDTDLVSVLNDVKMRSLACHVLVDFPPPPFGNSITLTYDKTKCAMTTSTAPAAATAKV